MIKNDKASKQTAFSKSKSGIQSAKPSSAKSMGKSTSVMDKNTAKTIAKASKCKAEFATDNCKLTDMDIVSDVLATQKMIIGKYGKALCEIDCVNLRGIVNTQMTECAQDQFDSFLYMNQRGMYPTETAPSAKVNQMKKKYTQFSAGIKR